MIVIWVTCVLMMAPATATAGAVASLNGDSAYLGGVQPGNASGTVVPTSVATDESAMPEREARVYVACAAHGDDEPAQERRKRVYALGQPPSEPGATKQERKLRLFRQHAAPGAASPPKVWIGVRVTPVPAPLAAHLGGEGVMVANVVADSPADKGGLQQYDVIVQYAGKPLAGPKDLTDAVAASPAGRTVKVDVIRAGQRRQLRITPIRGADAPAEPKLKHEEQPAVFMDHDVKLRGLMLNRDDDGKWIIEQLGPLQNVPDILQELEDFSFDFRSLPKSRTFFKQFGAFSSLDPNDGALMWHGMPGDDADKDVMIDVQREVTIVVQSDDGGRLHVHQRKDGTITVAREDEQGNEITEIYESLEALEQADPEAHELLSGRVDGAPVFLDVAPLGRNAEELREQFQFIVRERLEDALQRLHESQDRIVLDHEEAMERARERLMEAELRKPAGAMSESLGVRVGPDGTYTVYLYGEDGRVEKLHFDSAEAFEAAEPELYARFEPLLRE